MNSRKIFLIIFLITIAIILYLVFRPGADTSSEKIELMLYCGAGIRPAANEVIREFEKISSVKIKTSYAGSGRLLAQISSIQKGDLYMPGAEFYSDIAIKKGLAYEKSRRFVSYFIPVIFVQKNNPKGIRSLDDLVAKDIRIGLGDPRACAIGKRTIKLLEKNEINYETIKEKVVYKSGTVNELGVAVQMKSVDAVIIWDANAKLFEKYGHTILIPKEKNSIATIPICILKSTKHYSESEAFIDFITSNKGKKIFKHRGYTVE
jgi:molybdate transport system substrate-binding protein